MSPADMHTICVATQASVGMGCICFFHSHCARPRPRTGLLREESATSPTKLDLDHADPQRTNSTLESDSESLWFTFRAGCPAQQPPPLTPQAKQDEGHITSCVPSRQKLSDLPVQVTTALVDQNLLAAGPLVCFLWDCLDVGCQQVYRHFLIVCCPLHKTDT